MQSKFSENPFPTVVTKSSWAANLLFTFSFTLERCRIILYHAKLPSSLDDFKLRNRLQVFYKGKVKNNYFGPKTSYREVLTQFNNTSKYNLSGHDWLYDVHNKNKTDKKTPNMILMVSEKSMLNSTYYFPCNWSFKGIKFLPCPWTFHLDLEVCPKKFDDC